MRERLETLFPTTIGYEPSYGPTLAPSNTDVLRRAKTQGAITAYVHAFQGETDPMTAGLGLGKAFPVDAALGTVDAIEWAAASRGAFIPWYAALNNGLRITAIGGEDTIDNLAIMRLVGSVRTYAACDGGRAPTAGGFWDGIQRGRAFVTTGPLVELTVGGKGAGDSLALAAPGAVEVRAWVRSITPLQRVTLIQNGRVVRELPLDSTRTRVDVTASVPVDRSGWLHLRAEGSAAERFPLDALYAQAFTNPVWVTVGGQPVRDRASAAYALKWIDMLQLMADAWPGWASAPEKRHVFGQFDEARRVWRRLADEAPAGTDTTTTPRTR
jgi:TolB protein